MPRLTSKEHFRLYNLSKTLHWLKINPSTARVELYLDNHMMQTFRACPSRFMLEFVEGWKSKNAHLWFLDFGACFHSMIEYYYTNYKNPDFDVLHWAGNLAFEVWNFYKLDELYGPGSQWHHKGYETLGGFVGFSALLLEYANNYHTENERFRVVGTELYFGKGKEVPLLDNSFEDFTEFEFDLFLCGKIDLLMDDGSNIGPMDHKTASAFGAGNPITNYEVHEGMTGYVYAGRKLLKLGINSTWAGRTSNKIWINFVQVAPLPQKHRNGTVPLPSDRFKRIPMFVSDYQLEQYRLRQISTANQILQHLGNPELLPYRNTMLCTNYMHHICSFHGVHRQNSEKSELIQLNSDFSKQPLWNPEERDNEYKL